LVVSQVALAGVLAVGALLLALSFTRLLDVNPGFVPERLLTLQMTVPDRVATADERRQFYAEFFERIEALPGVVSAGGTTRLPLGSTNVTTQVMVEGGDPDPARLPEVEFRRAVHLYFETMGIPVLRGRSFDERDGPNGIPVVVLNQTASRRLFGAQDPIGRRLRMGSDPDSPWSTVVGVIGDIKHESLDSVPAPELYIYHLQNPPVAPFIVIRTAGDSGSLAAAVRSAARALDPHLALYDIRTMAEVRGESVSHRRFMALLAGLFGLTALALASVGVYGAMALMVSERTREIGIRLALGARPAQVWGLVVGEALTLAAAGTAIGLGLSRLVVPLMESELYGVAGGDPVPLVLVPVVLAAAALAACLLPARRAMRVDPLTAIRAE
jgi:putative ABC transport system permease protein